MLESTHNILLVVLPGQSEKMKVTLWMILVAANAKLMKAKRDDFPSLVNLNRKSRARLGVDTLQNKKKAYFHLCLS